MKVAQQDSTPAVTLLIPTFNAGPEFPSILEVMQCQQLDCPWEILVIDSGSTDGTVEFLRGQRVRLIEIPNGEFSHGATRARGIREAQGEIVVLATQDARPADGFWMRRLIETFSDPSVAGAYSRQVPRPDADPFARARLENWLATSDERRVQTLGGRREFDALPPLQKLQRVGFDNVSSSVRRRIALEIPFENCAFGEDLDWAYRVLTAGYSIVYEPRSCVIHSHNNSAWYELKRVYLDHKNLRRLFGIHTIPRRRDIVTGTIGGAVRLARSVLRNASLTTVQKVHWSLKAIPRSFAQSLGQYLGGRTATGGIGRWLDRRLSRGV